MHAAAIAAPGRAPEPGPHGGGRPGTGAVGQAGREAAPALGVIRLTLSEYRCYGQLRLQLDTRPVVLTGPNGAGKTNILEALSFLAPGRGLRRARLGEIGRRYGAPGGAEADGKSGPAWAVAATLTTPDGPVEIGTGTGEGGGPERRIIRIDGVPRRGQQALAETLAVSWLAPEMDRLFLEGASGRRRFLDRLVTGFDPEHASRLAAYEHRLRERARLLREGGADGAWLHALEEGLAAHGVAIAAARREVLARLARVAASGHGPFPGAGLALAGRVETWLDTMPALAVEETLALALRDSRSRDAETGGAAEGPHRTDLLVRHLAKDRPAEQCSTGEQKALLIALVLADARLHAAERGLPPLLLLDEVAAHLDAARRAALFDALTGLGVQAWLTGTDRSLFEAFGDRAQFLAVADAAVLPG